MPPNTHPNSGVQLCSLTVKALSVEDSPETGPQNPWHWSLAAKTTHDESNFELFSARKST
jgi:hypothetical protein